MSGDLGASFQKLMSETFVKYRGCLIERASAGYCVGKKFVSTLDEAKSIIDNAMDIIAKSFFDDEKKVLCNTLNARERETEFNNANKNPGQKSDRD